MITKGLAPFSGVKVFTIMEPRPGSVAVPSAGHQNTSGGFATPRNHLILARSPGT
jgi:hypothetical protein